MQYIILDANNCSNLIDKVGNFIKKGYEPVGGIAVTNEVLNGSTIGQTFYQTMILNIKKSKKSKNEPQV